MNIITAIGNPILNDKLRKMEGINIIGKDIQYQEGIIESLELRNDIDLIIMSNSLPEEYGFYKLINKIKEIKDSIEIVVFLEKKDENIENFLASKNIYKINYLNEIDFDEFIYTFFDKKGDILDRNC